MKKKFALLACVLALAITVFAACGGGVTLKSIEDAFDKEDWSVESAPSTGAPTGFEDGFAAEKDGTIVTIVEFTSKKDADAYKTITEAGSGPMGDTVKVSVKDVFVCVAIGNDAEDGIDIFEGCF